ncbi:MAG: GNAT family N-acetyltransferase [Gammaproteobacteria bacterium]|nr:GNAT family N-acetyltransferase [Gammaproteobacteria bacterium]
MNTIRLLSEDDLPAAYPVMAQLRPHLSEDAFITQCAVQFAEGFQLAGLEQGGRLRALAGFRIHHKLVSGKTLYVDDLVTDGDSRSAGHGAALIAWLRNYGRERGCALLSLDSGVQRFAAHRFYLRERFDIGAHHFILEL